MVDTADMVDNVGVPLSSPQFSLPLLYTPSCIFVCFFRYPESEALLRRVVLGLQKTALSADDESSIIW